jgi:hypothetical protein
VTRRRWARAGAVPALLLALSCSDPDPVPPHDGRFVVECTHSHSAPDDPIVLPGQPGASHLHDFFGNVATDAHSTAADLVGGDTTCRTRQDAAAYWAPAVFDGDRQVRARSSDSYYRAAPGVDPAEVEPFPLGLMMISEDAGWTCASGGPRQAVPPACSGTLALRVLFPDCWDGHHLDSADHRAHVAASDGGGCPSSHPVALPQLEFVVAYEFSGDPSGLRLASGSVATAHADFLNAWDPEKLASEVRYCIRGDAVCGVPTI